MSHLGSCQGVTSGSNPSPISVQPELIVGGQLQIWNWLPSMSHLKIMWGGQLQIQLWIHICDVPSEGPLHLQLQFHPCLTLDHVGEGVNSRSGSNSRSIFGLQLFDLNLGSTPFLAPVPSMSYLRSCEGGGQLQIWIQLQIHIWVLLFYFYFHCIDIMLTLCYLQYSIFCPITLFQVVRFE